MGYIWGDSPAARNISTPRPAPLAEKRRSAARMVIPEVFHRMLRTCPRVLVPVSLFLVCAALAPVRAAEDSSSKEDMRNSLKKFTSFYDLIENNFADKVDADTAIYKGAIPSMLRTLDPHSNFFDPTAYALLREEQAGRYYGVGMLVGAPEGRVIVMYPFENSPAYKAGLRPGDAILAVNDKSTEGLDIPAVSSMLKGPQGTPVEIKIGRAGSPKPLYFTVTRGAVPRESVTYAFWFRPGIAYIKIESFNENTSHEFDQALNRLGEASIEGLILDLRDNGGGILQEAVAVSEHFLKRGQLIVSHHGRASAETKFITKKGEKGREYPIVVLVNRGTASAAEILTGALQDHDRAWVLGEQTFGKGLVQAPYPLSDNTALLLTIARYYTPSGRLIQRDYSHRSFYEYYSRLAGHNNTRDMKKTDGGRTVYGGDGITPDERFSEPDAGPYASAVLGNLGTFFFAVDYFGSHPAKLAPNWKPDDTMMNNLRAFMDNRGIQATDSEFAADREFLRERLREELFVTAFSKERSDQVALENDPELQKAMASMAQSRALLARKPQTVASKSSRIARLFHQE